MATSGTITFNQTRDQLITDSLSLLGVLAAGETASSNDITFCSGMLNKMVKGWQGQGIHLWTEDEATIFFVNGQNPYILQAGAGGANAGAGALVVETTLAVAASNNSSTITVASVIGMLVADTIGIQLDNNTIFWTTVAAINTTTKVVTLTAPLTSSASLANQVYDYTTQLPRPLSIQSARLRNNSGFDKPIKIMNRLDYDRIPNKGLSGQPVMAFFTPQLTSGQLFLWPVPNDVSYRLKVTYLRTIQDFDNSTDNPDFPQEWLDCITFNLAVRLAPAYGINLSSGGYSGNPQLITQAAEYLEEMKAWDAEQPSVSIVPNYDYR